jgi:hypothetical protein
VVGQRDPLVVPADLWLRGTVAEALGGNADSELGDQPLPLLNLGEAIQRLESRIRRSRQRSDLIVSIEHASGLLTFLRGMADSYNIRISRVIVRFVQPRLAATLIDNQALPKNYDSKRRENLKDCGAILAELAPGVEPVKPAEVPWPALPPLHGFLYDDCLLWGHWQVNSSGHLTVNNTRMWEVRRNGPFHHIFERLASLMMSDVPELEAPAKGAQPTKKGKRASSSRSARKTTKKRASKRGK